MDSAPVADELPRCRCGHDRTHKLVSRRGEYGLGPWLFSTFMGVTSTPKRVVYWCRICYQDFDGTDDMAVRRITT